MTNELTNQAAIRKMLPAGVASTINLAAIARYEKIHQIYTDNLIAAYPMYAEEKAREIARLKYMIDETTGDWNVVLDVSIVK